MGGTANIKGEIGVLHSQALEENLTHRSVIVLARVHEIGVEAIIL